MLHSAIQLILEDFHFMVFIVLSGKFSNTVGCLHANVLMQRTMPTGGRVARLLGERSSDRRGNRRSRISAHDSSWYGFYITSLWHPFTVNMET